MPPHFHWFRLTDPSWKKGYLGSDEPKRRDDYDLRIIVTSETSPGNFVHPGQSAPVTTPTGSLFEPFQVNLTLLSDSLDERGR